MPWWGVLIIVAVAVIAAVIVTWILSRRSKGALLDQAAVAEAQRKVAEKQVAAEKAAKAKVEKQRAELAAKLKAINGWYTEQSKTLKTEVRNAYEDLAGDPAALDRKLDQLLGSETD
jgi:uncharacterized membrane protein (DUF106 family)